MMTKKSHHTCEGAPLKNPNTTPYRCRKLLVQVPSFPARALYHATILFAAPPHWCDAGLNQEGLGSQGYIVTPLLNPCTEPLPCEGEAVEGLRLLEGNGGPDRLEYPLLTKLGSKKFVETGILAAGPQSLRLNLCSSDTKPQTRILDLPNFLSPSSMSTGRQI